MSVGPTTSPTELAADVLGHLARRDEPLAPLTTYRVGGRAALFVAARTVDDLVAVSRARRLSGLPVLVIGRGSNLLVADTGFTGIAVSTAGLEDRIDLAGADRGADGGDEVIVTASSGISLPVLARRTVAVSLTGFEWAVGVPGSVGGGVRMNAGGHGSDMAACLVDVDLVDLDDPDAGLVRRPTSELGLRFRSSGLTDTQVVVRARLTLRLGDRTASEREIAEIVRWRREHQPGGQNCGSVFVNPVPGEVTAGALIDGLSLRGFTIGGAKVSEKHANFVVAEPGATASDVHAVIEQVRERVARDTGFALRSEVRLVGFDHPHETGGAV
ncbi:UDP-N-acetylmuramate dehydrogenase [soil metagenome]